MEQATTPRRPRSFDCQTVVRLREPEMTWLREQARRNERSVSAELRYLVGQAKREAEGEG